MKTYLSPLESFIILSIYGISLFFFGFVCFASFKYVIGTQVKETPITYHKKNIKPIQQATETVARDSVSTFGILKTHLLLFNTKE